MTHGSEVFAPKNGVSSLGYAMSSQSDTSGLQELSKQKAPTIGLMLAIFTSIGRASRKRMTTILSAMNPLPALQLSHIQVVRFREFLAEDLHKRVNALEGGAAKELLMSAYLDPRTKNFGVCG